MFVSDYVHSDVIALISPGRSYYLRRIHLRYLTAKLIRFGVWGCFDLFYLRSGGLTQIWDTRPVNVWMWRDNVGRCGKYEPPQVLLFFLFSFRRNKNYNPFFLSVEILTFRFLEIFCFDNSMGCRCLKKKKKIFIRTLAPICPFQSQALFRRWHFYFRARFFFWLASIFKR